MFEIRDMYHGIGPLDPERLNVFRTVREITGEAASPLRNPMKKSVSLQPLCSRMANKCHFLSRKPNLSLKASVIGQNIKSNPLISMHSPS